MRDETKRKLDDIVAGERTLQRQAIVLGAFLCAAFGVFLIASKTTVSERLVAGNVTRSVWQVDHDTGKRFPDILVALDEGRLVMAGTLQSQLPDVGARVELREKTKVIGFHSYSWEGKYQIPETH